MLPSSERLLGDPPPRSARRRLRLGHAWPLGVTGLAVPLAEFVRRVPDLRVELLEDGPDALRRRFRAGGLDIVAAPPGALGALGVRGPVFLQPWALVTSRQGLFDAHGPDWSWLGELPLLVRPGDPWREAQAACRDAGGGPCDVRVLRSARSAVFDLVAAGLGWSLAPIGLAPSFPKVAFHRLPAAVSPYAAELRWAATPATPTAAQFVTLLKRGAPFDAQRVC